MSKLLDVFEEGEEFATMTATGLVRVWRVQGTGDVKEQD